MSSTINMFTLENKASQYSIFNKTVNEQSTYAKMSQNWTTSHLD